MSPEERKTLLTKLLSEQLQPESLTIIDESHFHIGHAGAKSGASHFAIEIKAACFSGLNKVKQHQKIYNAVGYLIPKEVHALRIVIL